MPLAARPANIGTGPKVPTKSPRTRAHTRRIAPAESSKFASAPFQLNELPDELLLYIFCQLARTENVPGNAEEDEATLRPGADAIVLFGSSRAARQYQKTAAVSKRWASLASQAQPWKTLIAMGARGFLKWEGCKIMPLEPGGACWAASSTSREEGKQDKWHAVRLPCGNMTVVLARQCSEEGVSYDIVRWVGCLQNMHHPCVAALQLVEAKHDPSKGTWVHAAFEHVETSLQKIVYGTLERTSHTVTGRALPPLMLRSFMYQLLSALACSHARGVAHGNLAPYRVLARALDASKGEYLLKLADFGFSPPAAALCNEELPIRPSRASPELHAEHKRKRYGPANDLWALGTVYSEVACGNRDPNVYMMIQELEAVEEGALEAAMPMLCENGRDLLRKLMRAEPTERITAAEALQHPYFSNIHEECPVVAAYLPPTAPAPTRFLSLRPNKAWEAGTSFLAGQPELNSRMWSILMDWLAVVSHKFKFVPRSIQLAVDFMRRYMMAAPVSRKRLQLIGIGSLCLACKHEEVMIPNMNDFIFICDNAYTLEELMLAEVEILNTLQMQLHVPTAHDHLQHLLVGMGLLPEHPDGEEPWLVVKWCEVLTLLGLTHYNVAIYDSEMLAKAVATLGGHLALGSAPRVATPTGSAPSDASSDKLHERVCFLSTDAEWDCFAELLKAIELTLAESREIIVKCHPEFTALRELGILLPEFAEMGHEPDEEEILEMLDSHYSEKRTAELNLFNDFPTDDALHLSKKPNFRGINTDDEPVFSIPAVTCAIGRQMLAQRAADARGV